MRTNYRRLITGQGSAIDEYIVHKNLPLCVTNIIDFKSLRTQQSHLTLKQQQVLFLDENAELGERFLLIVYVKNKKTLQAITKSVNQKGVKIMLMKKSAINSPILKEKRLHFFDIQFSDPVVQEFIRNGEISFFKSVNALVDGLIRIFDENHKRNLEKLFPYKEINNKILTLLDAVSYKIFLYESGVNTPDMRMFTSNERFRFLQSIKDINKSLSTKSFNTDRYINDYNYLIDQLDHCLDHQKLKSCYVLSDLPSFKKRLNSFELNVLETLKDNS